MSNQSWSVFTGAGISAAQPAGLPLGYRLRDLILERLVQAAHRTVPGILSPGLLKDLKGTHWKLEYVLGRLGGTIGGLAEEALSCLVVAIPNEAHMAAAAHLALGGRHVTVNFDQGIEIAYELLAGTRELPDGAPPAYSAALARWRDAVDVVAPTLTIAASRQDFRQRRWEQGPALVKLHGTLRTDPARRLAPAEVVVSDEQELARLPAERLAALDWMSERPVLVTGYSGADIDCYEPLLARLSRGGFRWVARTVGGEVQEAVRAIDRAQPEKGQLAAPALREVVGRPLPFWPEEPVAGLSYRRRFEEWKQRLDDREASEALAWMLHDAGRRGEAVALLEPLAQRGELRTRVRLADTLYDHEDDRRRAAGLYWRVAAAPRAARAVRVYGLLRWGEAHRRGLADPKAGPRPSEVLKALLGPLAALAIAGRSKDLVGDRARALNAIGHVGLRVLEDQLQHGLPGRGKRLLLRVTAVAVDGTLRYALHLIITTERGNRQIFLRQQAIEAAALRAWLEKRQPDPQADRQLAELGRAYSRMPDRRGQANVTAAQALVAMCRLDLDSAEQLLREAEGFYRQCDGSIDHSGSLLVARRRALLTVLLRSQAETAARAGLAARR